ncbi:MAG: hypothetical protein M3P33_01835 [bacterium]|nr:hypothetical protein [bacterium]
MFDVFYLENKIMRAGVNPHGGYVTSWVMKDSDVTHADQILYIGSSIKRTGIPILFPNFGKSEQLKMHGFGRDCLWKVMGHSDDSVVMELGYIDIPDDCRGVYPYLFLARIIIQISEKCELVYSLEVVNNGDIALPVSPGIHPYWNIQHEDKNKLVINGISGFDSSTIDWDNAPPDNDYEFFDRAEVLFVDKKLIIEDMSDGGEVIKWLIVWTQTPRDDDYRYICVEPVRGSHYSYDKVPVMVDPGQSWEMKVKFTIVQN